MKNGLVSNRVFFSNVGKPAREPLRTIDEMAEEFGVTRAKLSALLRYRDGPEPEMKHNNKRTNRATWYSPSKMRKWWREAQP